MQISVFADVKPLLGESPLWDAETQRLYFIDGLGKRIFRTDGNGANITSWIMPSEIGSIALAREDRLLVALRDGFHWLDLESGELTFIANPEPDAAKNRLNDGKVDPAGRFVCGSMDTGEESPTGMLWQLGSGMSLRKLDNGIICSNGPCWSPDGTTLYFADSFQSEIYAYDYDVKTGSATNKRVFVEMDKSRGGAPDGATVDAEGFIWSAGVFDGRIFRYAPDGSVDRIIEMPVCKITSLNFGGADLDRLFVTSMAEPPLPKYPGDGPLRGAVFVIDGLPTHGIAEPRFAG
ncbi:MULTISPECIES: SMP-30/gluconolactonase/LRE family protein [Halocynthiibacter]|uniref:SMP-30/gluconolactonase/LRE family protein n=1 Tax=Halocynthiibacter halioticoli TaxID=2986804 RepID=A0AAE3LSI5_9RHOB|nr:MULTISPECIES: SMP-30/gluconolactonase/LRE family protein [Halocynthiibacter]MCV6823496.1 SMP-30/gluconolactonase/LRE family protein [Halocynthiibacter halioticoli]MCW4056497.1 SMP-30/gluconolactonase/LRE family protein [Halocynthiibacter sp. SDUM655004]